MPSRVEPLEPGKSDDEEVNEILEQFEEGWWADTVMMGTIGRVPPLQKPPLLKDPEDVKAPTTDDWTGTNLEL